MISNEQTLARDIRRLQADIELLMQGMRALLQEARLDYIVGQFDRAIERWESERAEAMIPVERERDTDPAPPDTE